MPIKLTDKNTVDTMTEMDNFFIEQTDADGSKAIFKAPMSLVIEKLNPAKSEIYMVEFELALDQTITTTASAGDIYDAYHEGKIVIAKVYLPIISFGGDYAVYLSLYNSDFNAYTFRGTFGAIVYEISCNYLGELTYTETNLATEEYVDDKVFVIQWDGSTGDKTYEEVAQAIAEHKIPVLYDGDKCIATFTGESSPGASFVFLQSNMYNVSCITEYVLYSANYWEREWMDIVKQSTLDETISADNEDFKSAVLNCFPDADTMSFPLEETVSEVSEE